jgi:vancomycin permeability regulator SanA
MQRRNKSVGKRCRPLLWGGCAALALLLVLLVAVLCINATVRAAARDRLYGVSDTPPVADCILVLGAGVRADGTPSDMLRDRILRGVALYKAGCAPLVMMSGDSQHPDSYDEVGVMRQYAIDAGVPAEAILIDPAGLSTADSMKNLAGTDEYRTVIIVSQTYHLYRAVFLADRYGLDAVGASADYHTYFGQTYRNLREIAARCKDFLLSK